MPQPVSDSAIPRTIESRALLNASALSDPYGQAAREEMLHKLFSDLRSKQDAVESALEICKNGILPDEMRVMFQNPQVAVGRLRDLRGSLIHDAKRAVSRFDIEARDVRLDELATGLNLECENPFSEQRLARLLQCLDETFGSHAVDVAEDIRRDYARQRARFERGRSELIAKVRSKRRPANLPAKKRSRDENVSRPGSKKETVNCHPPERAGWRRMNMTEAAIYIGISPKQLGKWIRGQEGAIKCEHVSGQRYDFDAVELESKRAVVADRKGKAEKRKAAEAAKKNSVGGGQSD